MVWIGIDTGTHTGVAVWDSARQVFLQILTLPIHRAMELVKEYPHARVVFEDARKRRWYGRDERNIQARLQGAGSVKRDCAIWEDYLTDKGIDFFAVAPHRGMTKKSEEQFRNLTGWTGRTSEHSRDAGMLVWGK